MNEAQDLRAHQSHTAQTHGSVPYGQLLAILLLALIARVLAMAAFLRSHPAKWFYTHPYEMGFLANSLIHGLGYSSPFGPPTGPTAFIAPGYPTLIAGIFLLFGSGSFASVIVIVSLQILVAIFTVWLIMHVAALCCSRRAAIVAGVFWAISLPLLYIPGIFWETSFSACALLAMVALALRCRDKPTGTLWTLMGVFCAAASLTNPALLPSLLLMLGWTAWQTRSVSLKRPTFALVTMLVLFSPWPIRNALRFHAFIPLRSTVGFEMYMGNRPGADGRLDEKLFPMSNRQEFNQYVSMGEVAYTRDKSRQASAWIKSNPAKFAVLSLRRAYRFWSGSGNLDGPRVFPVHALLTTSLGFFGLWLLFRRDRALAILFALPIIFFPFPYYITHAEFRYRLNIDPIMTVLAACAAIHIARALRARTRTSTLPLRTED